MIYNGINIREKIDENYEKVLLDAFRQKYFCPETICFKAYEHYNIFALFSKYIDNNFYQMKKYYLQGIKNKNLNSMYNLGYHYFISDEIELSTKYFVLYIENKYILNFDDEPDDKITIIIDIFIHDKKIEDFENEPGKINYIIYEIFSLYYKIVKNNEQESKKYYLISLETKHNFYFGNNIISENISNELFLKIKNIFLFYDESNERYNKLLKKNNFNDEDIETIDILVLFFKSNNDYNKIIEIYEKCVELVDFCYLLKLSDILTIHDKKLSHKYKNDFEIKMIETKHNIKLHHKSSKFKKMFVDIFTCSDLETTCENYDINDYNVLFVLYLYYKFISNNNEISKKYLYFSIVKKYNIFDINVTGNEYVNNYFITNIEDTTIKLYNFEHEFFADQNEYEFNSNDFDYKDIKIVNLIGLYYEKKIINYDEAIKHYKIGIGINNIESMYILSSLYLKLKNEKLYLKYMRMFFEYNYDIDLDSYDNNQLKKIIEIFFNIKKKKYNLNNIENNDDIDIIEIVWLYYKYVQKNIDISNKYYIKLLKTKYSINFDFIINNKYLTNIMIKIFNHEIESNYLEDDIEGNIYYIVGLYYQKKEKNEKKSIEYYKKSFEKGNLNSSKNLANIMYKNYDLLNNLEDIELMENALVYVSDHHDVYSIIKLCAHYDLIGKYDLMIEYYEKGVNLDSNICAYKLGLYYKNINDYDKMKKYYQIVSDSEDYGDLEFLNNYCKIMGMINFELYRYNKEKMLEIDKESFKYLKKSSKYNYGKSFYELGNYYKQKNNITQMIKYYKKAIDKNNDSVSMYELGKYYQSVNQNAEKLKYFTMAFENDNFYVLYDLGIHFKNKKKYDKMEKYFKLAVENIHCVKSMYELGLYYCMEFNDRELMDKYYQMALAIEPDNQDILHGYANYYYFNNEYLKSIEFIDKLNEDKCYENIIWIIECLLKINDLKSIDDLLNGLDLNSNYEKWFPIIKTIIEHFKTNLSSNENILKYIVRGLNISNFSLIYNKDCETLYLKLKIAAKRNSNKIYYVLSNIINPNSFIEKKINELLKEQKVYHYSNKISLFKRLNNINECQVCYETKVHINFECGHEICLECYTDMNGCQFRCNQSRSLGNSNRNINSSHIELFDNPN